MTFHQETTPPWLEQSDRRDLSDFELILVEQNIALRRQLREARKALQIPDSPAVEVVEGDPLYHASLAGVLKCRMQTAINALDCPVRAIGET